MSFYIEALSKYHLDKYHGIAKSRTQLSNFYFHLSWLTKIKNKDIYVNHCFFFFKQLYHLNYPNQTY